MLPDGVVDDNNNDGVRGLMAFLLLFFWAESCLDK